MMISAFRLKGPKALGVVALIFTTMLVYADEYAYKPSGHNAEHTLKLGEKWNTDEVVRLGMDNIRQAVSASQGDIIQSRLSSQDYLRIANVVDQNVAVVVKKCRLSPDADKAFHTIVLVDLIGDVELMRTTQNVKAQQVGALGVLQTLRNYGKYFQHPGWSLEAAKSR